MIGSGAAVSATDNDGKLALSYVAQKGHREVVAELLRHGALEAALDHRDTLDLFIAVAMGDLEPVKGLVAKGVSTETKACDGGTPLFYAAECGRSDVVQFLIEHGASITVNASSNHPTGRTETLLTRADRAGHMKIFQAIIDAGAPVNVRGDTDGETPLISVARWDFFAGVQQLIGHGASLRFETLNEDECPLIPGTLETMKSMCSATFEFESVSVRVVDRLQAICSHLQQLMRLLLHFKKLRVSLSRFTGLHAITDKIQDFHEELDHFIEMLNLECSEVSWITQLDDDRSALFARLETLLGADEVLVDECVHDDQKLEAAMLLQYELKPRGGEVRSEVQDGIMKVLERFLQVCQIEAPDLPAWFISREDVKFHSWNIVRSERGLNYFEGNWRRTNVMVETSGGIDSDEVYKAASQWFELNHPNVIKLFGARHIGDSKFFAYELVPDGKQLQEFLCESSNRGLKWKILYEAALGLHYLLNRGVIHKDFRSDNIIVGSDLVPKLSGLREFAEMNNSDVRTGWNWMSPERALRVGDVSASAASNIYAFGMCIWGAVTLGSPWNGMDRQTIENCLSKQDFPERPTSMDDATWDLITKICAFRPSERVTIAYVLNRLKQFVLECDQVQQSPSSSYFKIENQSLDEHAFAELESATILNVLQSIQPRCEKLPDSRWMLDNVYPVFEFTFALLQERHMTPTDAEGIQLCASLSRFQRYLRTAVSEKSVFELARSHQVAESHYVVYSELDRMLDMLKISETDPIRVWKTQNSETQEVPASVPTSYLRLANDSSSPVTLNYPDESPEIHKLWTREGLTTTPTTTLPWYLGLRDLIFSESDKIGQGAFGTIYKGTWLDTPVVVKFMGYEEDFGTISTDLLLHEVRVWHHLNHPHVLKLFGVSHIDKRYFVCEFASNGDLTDYLKKYKESKHLMWQKMHEAALGLEYLHGESVVHNDLKCDNIMVGMDGKAKLIDFELSCLLNVAEIQIEVKKIGAVNWRSPEYLAGGRPSFASDVYSFAMCIIEVVSGDIPWGKSVLPPMVRYKVKKRNIPSLPEAMNDKQRNLIQLMTKFEPSERVKMSYVVDNLSEIVQDEKSIRAP